MLLITQSVYAHTDRRKAKKPGEKAALISTRPSVFVNTSLAANRHLVSPESDIETAYVSEEAADERTKAAGVFSELDKTGKYLDDLVDKDMLQLPVGFKKTLGNGSVEVAVSRADFYAQYAELTVYVRMTLPSSGLSSEEKTLFFGAEKVRFTSAGGISSFKALLLGDVVLTDKDSEYSVIIKGSNGLGGGGEVEYPNQTYAKVDCGSFTEAQLTAEVALSRKTAIPLTEGTLEPMEGRVTCEFRAKIKNSIDNLTGALTFKTPFSSPNVSGFAFKIINAAIDLSNGSNPDNISFPVGYKSDMTSAWQGVYIQNFTVFLPKQFKKKNSSTRASLSALNVVIDHTGFSGLIEAKTPIFSVNEGSASGWGMSLDYMRVGIVQGTLTEGIFNGKIRLPISQNKTFTYTGIITQSIPKPGIDPSLVSGFDYGLKVSNDGDIDFDLFKAKGKIYEGSEITLAVINDEFKPRATLSGMFTIKANLDGSSSESSSTIQLNNIEFRNLILQTGTNPICIESVVLQGSTNIANFPLSGVTLGLKTSCNNGAGASNQADLTIGASINLLKGNSGFGGGISLTFRAEQDEAGNWKFKEIVRPIRIGIQGDVSAFSLAGEIELYDEQKGNFRQKGFRGNLNLKIKSIGDKGLDICADAEFGSALQAGGEPDNYFYVAGSVKNLSVPIPIGGPIAIDGFAGGIYSRMKPVVGGGLKTKCGTGLSYAYSDKVSFGFKAGVNLAIASPGGIIPKGAIDGYAGFEMVFSENGGLASAGLFAQAQLLALVDNDLVDKANEGSVKKAEARGDFDRVPEKLAFQQAGVESKLVPTPGAETIFDTPMDAPLAARLGIVMDLKNGSFHGEANLFVNIGYLHGQGGSNPSEKNMAGRLVIHAGKDLWYIHFGTSERPMGLAITDLPKPLDQSYIRASTYLMIGGGIPDKLPELSPLAYDFFGIDRERYTNRKTNPLSVPLSEINSGKGFAFGLNFEARIKISEFVYAEGLVGLGLDILYTTKGSCGVGTAKGRAYAFVTGKLGVAGIPFVGAGVGVYLEGGAPAPLYFTGIAVLEVTLIETFRGKLEINVGNENECPPVASN